MGYREPKLKIICKSYDSGKLIVQRTTLGPQTYDDSSSRVMFWNFRVLSLMIIINRTLWPHFVFILVRMTVATTSLLRDRYHHSSCCIYRLLYFRYLIEYVFTVSLFSLQYVCVNDAISFFSFLSHINQDQWYHSNMPFDCF